jgi:uncharacterized protein (TIGR02996 family)
MNEDALLSVLRDDPGDEVTWAALADFFDDSGQPERAELMRLMRSPLTTPLLEPTAASARVLELLAAGVKPVTVGLTNSIGMEFVLVQPGTFLMGEPPGEEWRGRGEKQHEVTLTRPFYLGVYPVTQGQWKRVMGYNPSSFSRTGQGRDRVEDVSDAELDLFPVEQVSWTDAQDFLQRLATLDKEARNAREYRLPSEAEWEYACRGGHFVKDLKVSHTLPFHFDRPSSSLDYRQANFGSNYPYGRSDEGPDLDRPSKVGSYRPNLLGLFDMHGNVWEWCADWYERDYYNNSPTHDPTGPTGPSPGAHRVIRGGSWWCTSDEVCRAANRFLGGLSDRYDHQGFRVAAVPHK